MVAKPHGGILVNLPDLKASSHDQKAQSVEVDSRTAVNLFLIKTGVYSPLSSFSSYNDYMSILQNQRLENGIPWSIPIVLDIDPSRYAISKGDLINLTRNGSILAEMLVDDIWDFDKSEFCKKIFGTNDPGHPGVMRTLEMGQKLVSGKLVSISGEPLPFSEYFLSPAQTREAFAKKSWKKIAAFQTRNIPHLGHEYIQKSALNFVDGLFINPVIGKKKRGDFRDEIILGAYQLVLDSYYAAENVLFSTLNYEMYYAGPREAVLHAIMRKNFGCTHFIVGRDHAGTGNFYKPYAAQENLLSFDDLGIEILPFEEVVYCNSCGWITTINNCPHGLDHVLRFSASLIRDKIRNKLEIPAQIIRRDEVEWIEKQDDIFEN
ncbi:sulfate adenylyltransferase [Thermoplasmatales archaeon]|nr:sulfate adenylyltransferase [Thermoplasmatales archaeon]